jgi:hypothetical protein
VFIACYSAIWRGVHSPLWVRPIQRWDRDPCLLIPQIANPCIYRREGGMHPTSAETLSEIQLAPRQISKVGYYLSSWPQSPIPKPSTIQTHHQNYRSSSQTATHRDRTGKNGTSVPEVRCCSNCVRLESPEAANIKISVVLDVAPCSFVSRYYLAALGQVFSEYFGFPCQSFHQFLHHHNHPGLAQ